MTRLQYFEVGGSASSGGQQGGDTVFLGPEFGEPVDLTVGVDLELGSLDLGPFDTPTVGAASNFALADLGPFSTPAVGASASLSAAALGPFARNALGAAVTGTLVANGLDPAGDTYIQQAAPTTTAGSATILLAKLSTVAGSNEERAIIAYDLTGYAGTTITSATFHFACETDAAAAANAPWDIRTRASPGFTESTAHWNNTQPLAGTVRQSGTVNAPSNTLGPAWAARTIAADATLRANMPGNWVFLRFTGADALGVNRIRIQSKENGSPTQLPKLDLQVTL